MYLDPQRCSRHYSPKLALQSKNQESAAPAKKRPTWGGSNSATLSRGTLNPIVFIGADLRSTPRFISMAVFMMFLAVRSMLQSRPEWTMSFSEAPDIRLSNQGGTAIIETKCKIKYLSINFLQQISTLQLFQSVLGIILMQIQNQVI